MNSTKTNSIKARELSPVVERRELVSWALYDFANSGYTTVIMTTIYSAYFVGVIAFSAQDISPGMPTLLWIIAIMSAYFATEAVHM